MFRRFVSFVEGDPTLNREQDYAGFSANSLQIDGKLTLRWVRDLIDHDAGVYTPKAAHASATIAAVEACALLLGATTRDISLRQGTQALAIRIENTAGQC